MNKDLKVVEGGQRSVLRFENFDQFEKTNEIQYPMGEVKHVESPITLKVWFVDGNNVKFRGDRHADYVPKMVANLLALLTKYRNMKVLKAAVMYDNRDFYGKVVFEYKEGKMQKNYLPLYSPIYAIN